MLSAIEKKSIIVFMVILTITMLLGFAFLKTYSVNGADENVMMILTAAQMLYPMFAVILTLLLMRCHDKVIAALPKRMFAVFVLYTVFAHMLMIYGFFDMNHFVTIFTYGIFIFSVIFLLVTYLENKDVKKKYGMAFIPVRMFLAYSVFFILFIASIISIQSFLLMQFGIYPNEYLWGHVLHGFMLSLNIVLFLLQILLFIGEEFAWRGFLQPLLQKRFGVTKGLILLGVLWSFWHLPISIMVYSSENFILELINRTAFCIFLSCLLGYIYMKTKSLVLSAFLHFMNNMFVSAFGSPINQTFQVKEVLISTLLYVICTLLVIKVLLSTTHQDLEGFIEKQQ